jgi:hypothetical protein
VAVKAWTHSSRRNTFQWGFKGREKRKEERGKRKEESETSSLRILIWAVTFLFPLL